MTPRLVTADDAAVVQHGFMPLRRPSPYPTPRIGSVGPRGIAIAREVAAIYGLTLDQIRSRARYRSIAWPRQHVMSAMRAAGYSEPAIGRFLCRDASTVSDGDQRHRERLAWADVMTVLALGQCQPDLFARAA